VLVLGHKNIPLSLFHVEQCYGLVSHWHLASAVK